MPLEQPSLPSLERDIPQLVAALDAFFQNLVVQHNELMPAGSILGYAGVNLPEGWLLCDGAVYEIEDFKDLAKAIGQTYGGTGSQFQVPDYRDKVLFGASATRPLGTQEDALENVAGSIAGVAVYWAIKAR